MKFIGYLIIIAIGALFFWRARKFNVSPWKWSIIAMLAWLGPQLILLGVVYPLILILGEVPTSEHDGIRGPFGFLSIAFGFFMLGLVEKKIKKESRN